MDTDIVIVVHKLMYHLIGLPETIEFVACQAFLLQDAVKGLNMSILIGRFVGDKLMLYP